VALPRAKEVETMWHVIEDWQLTQLRRLAGLDRELAETVLNTIWNQYPGLFEQVIISALDQSEISASSAGQLLSMDEDAVTYKLMLFRKAMASHGQSSIIHEPGKDAKLAGGSVSVWEVVREYRKIGSVERLIESFPSLSTAELAAALKYAAQHPAEIEAQIGKYEETVARRRRQFPFAMTS
jgi:uncharacterized protein (DUF433 family)